MLEGESLINDATGLLALEFAIALVVTGETPSFIEGAGRLLYLVIGGVGSIRGAFYGALWYLLHGHINPVVPAVPVTAPVEGFSESPAGSVPTAE